MSPSKVPLTFMKKKILFYKSENENQVIVTQINYKTYNENVINRF